MQMCVWEKRKQWTVLLAGWQTAETSHGAHGFPPVILRGSFVRSIFSSLMCLWCEGLGNYFFDFWICMHAWGEKRAIFSRRVLDRLMILMNLTDLMDVMDIYSTS